MSKKIRYGQNYGYPSEVSRVEQLFESIKYIKLKNCEKEQPKDVEKNDNLVESWLVVVVGGGRMGDAVL